MPTALMVRDDRFVTRLTAGIVIVSLLYLSYRYPLRINFSATSSTYSNTPPALQFGKYVLITALLVSGYVVLIRRWRDDRRVPTDVGNGLAWLLALFAWLGASFLLARDPDTLTLAFAVLVAISVAAFREYYQLDPTVLLRILGVFAVIAVIADAVQIALFVTTGRLPALAYAGSYSIRFGSLLDDPNGYAILCSALLPAAWLWPRRDWARYSLTAAVFVSLVLTQSLTGFAATSAAVAVVIVATLWRQHSRQVVVVGAGLTAIGICVLWLVVQTAQFQRFLADKQGSIEEHGESFDVLFSLDWRALAGLPADYLIVESGYVGLLTNYGLVGLALFLVAGIGSIVRLRAAALAASGMERAAYLTAVTFQLAFLIAMINLPPQRVFPLDILFFVFVALSCYRQCSERLSR